MKRIVLFCALVMGFGVAHASAQSITLGGAASVASSNDFATQVFQDPWDMNERTDFGWLLNSADQPAPGFTGATFAGGLFSGIVTSDPQLWLLESGLPNLPRAVGKNGNGYAIDTNLYRMIAVRMRVNQPGTMSFFWSTNTIYEAPGLTLAGHPPTIAGWGIYFVDLPSLPLALAGQPWTGIKRSLRFDPAPDNATGAIDIDWIRLVDIPAASIRPVSFAGFGGNVDIYLDNDRNPNNDNLGRVATNVGSPYQLNAGALPGGTYYVAVRQTGTNQGLVYSTTPYTVNTPATIQVTSPSEEGSSDDFATVQLGNAWDMTSASDVDLAPLVANPGITTVPGAETEAGAPLGDITAFAGTSVPGVFSQTPCDSYGDPQVYPLFWLQPGRGASTHIDPNKYRILTADLGLPNKARDLCGGSIVRLIWRVAGDPNENVSWGISLNSRAGANVVNRINLDMAALPLEPSGSQSGWTAGSSASPGISSFRIDPHEFPNPTQFFIKRIKLAALETASGTYTVRWNSSKAGGTVRVYYDTDKVPGGTVLIGSTGAPTTSGSLDWNLAGVAAGAYYVYVEFDDGLNRNGTYSKWPVIVDSGVRLAVSRPRLNFGIRGGAKTPAQMVRLSALGAPAGQPCWSAVSDLWFVQVSPASGCGSALLTISLLNQDYPWVGDYSGAVRITPNGGTTSAAVQLFVRMNTSSSAPSGTVDTPANGAVVSGSVGVTGWAIDDIGIARVTICRDPAPGEPAPPNGLCGPNQVYIGDAVSIDGARPDVEAYSPTTALNYRAGWGLLILSNMLPNQGNGVFGIHARAFDLEGQQVELGVRYIDARNTGAEAPFGAIDTPAPGETIAGPQYPNFGWVLSARRPADPPDGGTVLVYVDGVAVGSPVSWNARPDISALFPGYPGVDRAVGVFGLNTLAYANGLHTIEWSVTDVGGVGSGIGSRYFSIFNEGAQSASGANAMRPAGADLGRRVDELSGSKVALARQVATREGFRLFGPTSPVLTGISGVRRVRATERDRLEIRLGDRASDGADHYAGYLVVDGRLAELPVGSSFDPARGAFYWQPGLGYLGDYDLMFVHTGAGGVREQIPVRVSLQPRPALSAAATFTRGRSRIEF